MRCSLCTATRPTYMLLSDALNGSRGRIDLIEDTPERGKAARDPAGVFNPGRMYAGV